MQVSIRTRALGKAYKRYPRKWGRLAEWIGGAPRHELHWALKDASMSIAPGEAVGIIGANGAGKSTLLKILAGTVRQTTGTVEVAGRLSALLELGLGFHGEFTGRQNVFMAGSLQGIPGEHMAQLFEGVEAFAEIGEYIDQPVRTYSSGMQVRLAFSVATVLRPDILIVDEALSVGDIYFQQKCFDRIRAYRDAGTTLLFVSHSLGTVYNLCTRAIFVEKGEIRLDGTPREAIDLYQARVVERGQQEHAAELQVVDRARAAGSYTTDAVRLESVDILDATGHRAEAFRGDEDMTVRVTVDFDREVDDPHIGFQIRDRMGQAVFMTTTHGLRATVGRVRRGERCVASFRLQPAIAPGQYTVTAGVANRGRFDGSFDEALLRHQDVAAFTVIQPPGDVRWAGVANLKPEFRVQVRPSGSDDAAGHH